MKNGYAICLNEWLDDPKISSELNLLLRISSLTAEKGYCYASNQYFSDKMDLSLISISRKIKKLKDLGYINIEYEKRGCEVVRRFIRLNNKSSTINKNVNRRLSKMLTDDYQKCYSTINKNVKDNNISNNNTNINNTSIISKPQKKFLRDSFEFKMSELFLDKNSNNPNINYLLQKKGEDVLIQDWCEHIDKLARIDKLTPEQIEYLIMFTAEHPFWSQQILSPAKFRKKNKEGIPYYVVLIGEIKQKIEENKRNEIHFYN